MRYIHARSLLGLVNICNGFVRFALSTSLFNSLCAFIAVKKLTDQCCHYQFTGYFL